MSTMEVKKNSALRRIKFLTLMQIGDSVRDIRTGNKAKLASKLAIGAILVTLMMVIFSALFWVIGSLFSIKLSTDMLITLIFIIQLTSIISCLSAMMLSLFASKENTMLLAFPCNDSEIFLSKIIVFALAEMKKNLYFLMPLLVGFGYAAKPGIAYWLQLLPIWFVLCLLPVFIGATIAIPAIFIKRFMQNHLLIYTIFMAAVVGAVFFAAYTILAGIEIPVRLLALYDRFVEGVRQAFIAINRFALFYNWVGKSLFGIRLYLYLPLVLLVLVAFTASCFLVAMPFYFKAASASNENSTDKKHRHVSSRKGGLLDTFLRKEMRLQFRTFQSVNSMIVAVFIFPVIIFVFNFFMAAINTSSLGNIMAIAFNFMIILSLLGSYNCNSAASISMEGSEFAVLKTAPSDTSVISWAKLIVVGIVNLMALIAMAVMLLMTTRLKLYEVILLMSCIFLISLGQLAWGLEFDIRKPKLADYASKGDGVTDNPNVAKAMGVSFLVSTVAGVLTLLMLNEHYVFGWVRVIGFSVVFMLARFWLLRSNLKVYFEDIQG